MAKRKKDSEDIDKDNTPQSDESSDNFGLPEIDYKPLDRTEPEPVIYTENVIIEQQPVPVNDNIAAEENTNDDDSGYEDDEESSSKAPVILIAVIVIVLALGGFAIWKYWYVPRAEKQRIELARQAEAARAAAAEKERLAKEQEEAERKRLEAEAAAKAKPAIGSIETLSERTGRFYVVLASDIDDDLIMDYAKRLSQKGVSTKIVPPFGKTKFYRLATGDYGSFDDAQAGADGSKAEYGSTLWVIKY